MFRPRPLSTFPEYESGQMKDLTSHPGIFIIEHSSSWTFIPRNAEMFAWSCLTQLRAGSGPGQRPELASPPGPPCSLVICQLPPNTRLWLVNTRSRDLNTDLWLVESQCRGRTERTGTTTLGMNWSLLFNTFWEALSCSVTSLRVVLSPALTVVCTDFPDFWRLR